MIPRRWEVSAAGSFQHQAQSEVFIFLASALDEADAWARQGRQAFVFDSDADDLEACVYVGQDGSS